MKLNKEEIRQIALTRFFDKSYDSIFDHWTDALECWLTEKGYKIVTIEDWAKIEAKRHMDLMKTFDRKAENEADREAKADPKLQD